MPPVDVEYMFYQIILGASRNADASGVYHQNAVAVVSNQVDGPDLIELR